MAFAYNWQVGHRSVVTMVCGTSPVLRLCVGIVGTSWETLGGHPHTLNALQSRETQAPVLVEEFPFTRAGLPSLLQGLMTSYIGSSRVILSFLFWRL